MKCAVRAMPYAPYTGQSHEAPFDLDTLSPAVRAVVVAVQSATRAPLEVTARAALAIEESARTGWPSAATFDGVSIPADVQQAWGAHLLACKSTQRAKSC